MQFAYYSDGGVNGILLKKTIRVQRDVYHVTCKYFASDIFTIIQEFWRVCNGSSAVFGCSTYNVKLLTNLD